MIDCSIALNFFNVIFLSEGLHEQKVVKIMKGNVQRLNKKRSKKWNEYIKNGLIVLRPTLPTTAPGGGPLNTEISANPSGSLLNIIALFLYFLTPLRYPFFPLLVSLLWCTLCHSLRILHRVPDSGESFDVLPSCSNGWECRYCFRESAGD